MVYEPRTYRRTVSPADLVSFQVMVRETDLQVLAKRDVADEALALALAARADLEGYIAANPLFGESYVPVEVAADAPSIVSQMAAAAARADVGPMAAVAGAVAEYVARGLAPLSSEVIVENGGDVYLMGSHDRTLALYAGESGVKGAGIAIPAAMLPVAVCTSSGTIGHSTSFGSADAVTVIARDGALADAVATHLGNRVHEAGDIEPALEAARAIEGVLGVVIAAGGHLGAWGEVRLVSL